MTDSQNMDAVASSESVEKNDYTNLYGLNQDQPAMPEGIKYYILIE